MVTSREARTEVRRLILDIGSWLIVGVIGLLVIHLVHPEAEGFAWGWLTGSLLFAVYRIIRWAWRRRVATESSSEEVPFAVKGD